MKYIYESVSFSRGWLKISEVKDCDDVDLVNEAVGDS